LGGRANRSKPCRPRQKRLQAPYDHLRTGHSARAFAQRRQPQRRPRAATPAGRNPVGQGQARPPASPARTAIRRRRLPFAPRPGRAACPRRRRLDPEAQERPRLRAWQTALGRRTHHQLASPVPATACPLRTTRRHPRSVPPHRWVSDLPQTPPSRLILLGALRGLSAAGGRTGIRGAKGANMTSDNLASQSSPEEIDTTGALVPPNSRRTDAPPGRAPQTVELIGLRRERI